MGVPPAVGDLIDGAAVSAHVATSVDDRPHVAPVWYEYEGGEVRFTTGGKKLRNLHENRKVAISIERATGPDVDWHVTLLGTARIVDASHLVREASRRIGEKYSDREDADRRDRDDDAATDGGRDVSVDDEAGRLVVVDVGSASYSVY